MFKFVLVPLDGSARAEAAIEYGVGLAKQFGGRVALLRAVALVPEGLTGKEQIDRIRAEQIRSAQAYLEQRAKQAAGEKVDIEVVTLPGDPARAILSFAEDKGVDAIIINSHGAGGLSGYVFGSVAEKVVRAAACPVLVLHQRPTAQELREQEEREEAEFDAVMGASLGATGKKG